MINNRTAKLAERLAATETLYGLIVKMPAPAVVELAGHTGFDLVVIDTEHAAADTIELEHHLRAADSAAIPAIVRVGGNDPLSILRTLDSGASGVIVPHVSHPTDAEAAVRAAHYPPIGTRGLAVTTRAGHHGIAALEQHLAYASRNTIVVAQIEDRDAVDHAAAISATAGLNAVWIGPSDLSLSMGLPGQLDHPDVAAAITKIANEVTASSACALCVLVDTVEQATAWRERGARIVLFNSTTILAHGLQRVTSSVRADALTLRERVRG